MLDNRANGRFPECPCIVVGENILQRDGFRYRAACRKRAEANKDTKSEFRTLIHLQPPEDEDWDNGADEIGKGVKSEPYVTHQVGDVRRKAFTVDSRIPDRSHWPALHKKQHDLCKVTSGTKSDDHPEEGRKVLPSPTNDP